MASIEQREQAQRDAELLRRRQHSEGEQGSETVIAHEFEREPKRVTDTTETTAASSRTRSSSSAGDKK